MKLISKFTDYYDSASSFGVDPNIVYVRTPEMEVLKDYKKTQREVFNKQRNTWRLFDAYDKVHIVGFCGKLYPFIRIRDRRKEPVNGIPRYFWKWSDELLDISEHERKVIANRINRWYASEVFKDNATYREILNVEPVEDHTLFHQLKTPIFLLPAIGSGLERDLLFAEGIVYNNRDPDRRRQKVFKSIILRDYDFYKVVDAHTAFQDIMMFISGVLGENKIPPVQISDLDMRDAKGFNERSFKKDPSKKRRK